MQYNLLSNWVHALKSFIKTKQFINTIIGNGNASWNVKIIERLKSNNEPGLIQKLSGHVEPIRKMHEVWKRPLIEKTAVVIHLFGKIKLHQH